MKQTFALVVLIFFFCYFYIVAENNTHWIYASVYTLLTFGLIVFFKMNEEAVSGARDAVKYLEENKQWIKFVGAWDEDEYQEEKRQYRKQFWFCIKWNFIVSAIYLGSAYFFYKLLFD